MNKSLLVIVLAALGFAGCGQSFEEQQRIHRAARRQLMREDSAALKVAVMPTLDCLPLYVAKERRLFDTLGVDIRLKHFKAQMDCDTALVNKRVEGAVTDLVRACRMDERGTKLRFVTATNAYWQLLTNRTARLKQLKQLDDKMLAMTRYSATDLLGDHAVDSAKLKTERVFRIQVNDVNLRLGMMLNNEMDALLLPEPQATQARMVHSPVLLDSRKLDIRLGVVAFREKPLKDSQRQRQLDAFVKAYNMACDTINKYGVRSFQDLIARYCQVPATVANELPKDIKFQHVAQPREKDVELAKKYLKGKKGS